MLSTRLSRMQDDGLSDEAGVTLIEMLVSMLIFSVVMAAAYSILGVVQGQSVDIQGREETVGNARIGLQQMDRQIRSGNVLYSPLNETTPASCQNGTTPGVDAGPCMRVYTQSNGEERCVQWQVLGNILRTRSWSATWVTDGQVSAWGTVARGLQPGSLFTLQGGSTAFGSRLVDIKLLVKNEKSKGAVQEVQTSLSGRNTLYGYDPGVCSPIPPSS